MFTMFSQSQMCDVPTKLNICSSFFSGSGYLFENWLVVLLQLLELFVQVFQPLLPAKRNEWMMKTTAILDQRQTVQRINQLIPLAKYQVIRPTTNQTSKWRERSETCLWHWPWQQQTPPASKPSAASPTGSEQRDGVTMQSFMSARKFQRKIF